MTAKEEKDETKTGRRKQKCEDFFTGHNCEFNGNEAEKDNCRQFPLKEDCG